MKAYRLAMRLMKHPSADVFINYPTGDNMIDGYSHSEDFEVQVAGEEPDPETPQIVTETSPDGPNSTYISIHVSS